MKDEDLNTKYHNITVDLIIEDHSNSDINEIIKEVRFVLVKGFEEYNKFFMIIEDVRYKEEEEK